VTPPTGHERMIARLAEIAAQARRDNPIFGDRRAVELRAAVAKSPPGQPLHERWALLFQLGVEELEQGNVDAAVAATTAAYDLLPRVRAQIGPRWTRDTIFQLGIAHMRQGETQNCVARHTSQSCIFPIQGGGVHQNQEGSRAAMDRFREVLAGEPDFLPARWLLCIAAMTVDGYPDLVPPEFRIDPARLRGEQAFPRFVDIAPGLGLNTLDPAGGAIADDFDNDGDLDLITSTWDPSGPMQYFRNDGGKFARATDAVGLGGLTGGLNMIQADYDNDGWIDVLVLRGGWMREFGRMPNSLLRNEAGRFRDVSYDVGIAGVDYPTQTGAWADYDLDGDLDLYVGNEADASHPYPSQLFNNDGKGRFTDVAREAGVENMRFAKGTTWGDYDGDRYPDLYVSNHGYENRLYHNDGNGKFTDVAPKLGVTAPVMSFPTWFWDFNNDGALDLFVASFEQQLDPFLRGFFGRKATSEPACLYQGDGRGGFVEVAAKMNLSRAAITMGANFGDLDNDGFLDFYLGTGYPGYEALLPNVMFRNRGGRGFSDVTTAGGFGHLQKGHGVAFADFDQDGDQDVFEQLGGAFPGDGFGDVLFENPGFGAHWIKVRLHGKTSNRFGIGARIRIDVADPKARRIYRHVTSGGSFGAGPLRLEIGLGGAKKIRVLEVFWPASNTTQVFRDVAVDQVVEITEGESATRSTPHVSFRWR